jgi:hypothetical protein
MISESDWKKFKKIKEAALERFCTSAVRCRWYSAAGIAVVNIPRRYSDTRPPIRHRGAAVGAVS